MTTVIIRPNSVTSGSANFTATGAANLHVATSDNSDSSYIRKTGSGTASVIIGFGTSAIANNEIVRRVRLRARVQTPTSDGKLNLALGTHSISRVLARGGNNTKQNWFTAALAVRGQNATGEVVGPWYSTAPNGSTWTQALIDEARIQVTEYRDSTDRAYVYELYIDVDKTTQPTVSVSDPSGTVTTTAAPDITWTFTDTDLEAQSYYEIKIFDEAAYTAAGFDPGSATPVWTSSQVASTSNTATVGTYLGNGSYRCYVRAAKSINGSPFWSAWAYSAFTISLTPPTTPTVTVAWDAATNKTTVTAVGAAAVGYDSQTFQVQRSDDAGLTWTDVRSGSALIPNTSHTATINDYEMTRGGSVSWRARSIAVLGSDTVASTWSASATATISNDGKWWFKVISNPTLNMAGVRVLDGVDEDQQEDVGIFRPIGRETPVVIAGDLYRQDGTYQVVTHGDTEHDALVAITQHQGTILVQDPFNTQKYVRIVSRGKNTTGAATAARRAYELGYVEVEA
jgi:hypothetical protein